MRRGDKTTDDLDRPEGNDLASNYAKHDIAQAEVIRRLEDMGFVVYEWGIDMRNDDGEDGVIYDDKMDLKVYDDGELVGLIDVKSKSGPRYMGRFNDRHYTHYYSHAADYEVPTFVVMFQVDSTTDAVHDEFVFDVGKGHIYDRVESSRTSDAVSVFPDRNHAVLVPHEERETWNYLHRRLLMQSMENDIENGEATYGRDEDLWTYSGDTEDFTVTDD